MSTRNSLPSCRQRSSAHQGSTVSRRVASGEVWRASPSPSPRRAHVLSGLGDELDLRLAGFAVVERHRVGLVLLLAVRHRERGGGGGREEKEGRGQLGGEAGAGARSAVAGRRAGRRRGNHSEKGSEPRQSHIARPLPSYAADGQRAGHTGGCPIDWRLACVGAAAAGLELAAAGWFLSPLDSPSAWREKGQERPRLPATLQRAEAAKPPPAAPPTRVTSRGMEAKAKQTRASSDD